MKNLFILPFDHRSSFYKDLLGVEGKRSAADKEKVQELKRMIYKAFLLSEAKYKKNQNADFGILVDEAHGSDILKDAKKHGFVTMMTMEKSGQKEFEFEYGNAFRKHLEKVNPTFAKVLVRYNPANKKTNQRQLKRLKVISDYCENSETKLLFELLVPATQKDLNLVNGSQFKYDRKLRPAKTVQAIKELRKKVDVHTWKLEGFTSCGWKKVLPFLGKDDQVIVLGRGQNDVHVHDWLVKASRFKPVIGFAVGRTVFKKPLKAYLAKKTTKKQTIEKISSNFNKYIKLWLKNKK